MASGDERTDGAVVVGRHSGDLLDLGGIAADLTGDLAQLGHQSRRGLVHAPLEVHGIGTSGHIAEASADHRLGEDRCCSGTVSGHVSGLRGDLLDHLGTHILNGVLQFDFLGDRDAVLGDSRCTELLVDNHVAALGTERDLYGVGQGVDAGLQLLPGCCIKGDFLRHVE